jgi:hypothetical protein
MSDTHADQGTISTCRVMRVRFHRTAAILRTSDPMRRAMAVLWNDMVRVHQRIRRSRWKWPTQKAFDAHFVRRKDRYAGLPSACVQQAVRKFFGNIKTTQANRKLGLKARFVDGREADAGRREWFSGTFDPAS